MKIYINKMCAVALMALCALPAIAQLNGTGYYRFRNSDRTTEYISFANNLFDYVTMVDVACGGFNNLTGDAGQARALTCASRYMQTDIHMTEDADCIDPSTVIYALQKTTAGAYDLIGQSTSLTALTNGSVSHPNSSGSPTLVFKDIYAVIKKNSGSGESSLYTAYVTLQGTLTYYGFPLTRSLGDRYFVDTEGMFDIAANSNAQSAKWYIEPVDHFNVNPTVAFNGRYYTTVCVPFDFKLAGQVLNAYAITAVNGLANQVVATTGGTVLAGTPVILECASAAIADCRLDIVAGKAPRTDSETNYTGTNLLQSTYFCNTDGIIYYDTASGVNAGNFNADNYTSTADNFVIGINTEGKLGFIPATGTAMPANQAWLTSSGVFPAVATPTITPAGGTYTEGQTVTITAEDGTTIEYSTDGGNTWQTYTEAITVAETTTIQAHAIKPGLYNNSDVASAEYVIETVSVNLGDVNDDGIVDINDVTCLIDHLLGLETETFVEANANVDGDNEISINDVTTLIDFLLGIITF